MGTKTKGKSKKKSVKLNTEKLGPISSKQLARLVTEAGSYRKLADSLGIAYTTPRSWALRLRKLNQ